mgnify:CR=1 FL=1
MNKLIIILFIISYFTSNIYTCTGIFASKNDKTLVGANEDNKDPINRICFVKPQKGKYGRVYLGYRDFYDACLNDQGLFYDGF